MLEIAELADVGAGTVYNYFKSKDELAIAVLEEMMHDLALQIEKATAAELVWHLSAHAIVGVSLAITTERLPPSVKDETIVRLLCMTGIGVDAATELAARPKPAPVVSRRARR